MRDLIRIEVILERSLPEEYFDPAPGVSAKRRNGSLTVDLAALEDYIGPSREKNGRCSQSEAN